MFAQVWRQFADRQTNLIHAISVSHRHGLIFQSLEINCNAVWRANLILPTIPTANTSRVIILSNHLAL
jgi:hypothetical protein